MKEYKVEWAEYNKLTTKYKDEYDSETVKAENEPEAIELVKQYIFDNTNHEEHPEMEITEDGIEFKDFEYRCFRAKEVTRY